MLGWAGPVLAFAALLGARRRPAAIDQLAAGASRDADASTPSPGRAADGRRARHAADADAATSRRATGSSRACCDAVLGRPATVDWYFAALGLVAQLVLAVGHTLATEAPLDALAGAAPTTEALVAVATIGAIAFLAARLSGVFLLDVLALTALAQFTGLALEGLPLTLALAAEAGLLALISQRASLAFVALAAAHALYVLAPPIALIDGLDQPYEAAAGARRRHRRAPGHRARPQARARRAALSGERRGGHDRRPGARRPDAAQRAVGAQPGSAR